MLLRIAWIALLLLARVLAEAELAPPTPFHLAAAHKPQRGTDCAAVVADLIDPARLATLRERGANPRVQKYLYWLETASRAGENPTNVVRAALAQCGMKGLAAQLTQGTMLRNLAAVRHLGCTNDAGMADMRRGQSPTVARGPSQGQELTIDHIVPLHYAPELDRCMANLEVLPQRLNSRKKDQIGPRQLSTAQSFHQAGLLSAQGWKAVLAAAKH